MFIIKHSITAGNTAIGGYSTKWDIKRCYYKTFLVLLMKICIRLFTLIY